jgi:nitrogen fixation NifU-like protein
MSYQTELYQRVILDHNRRPRNFGPIPEGAPHTCEGENPSCGDEYTVRVDVEDDVVVDAAFHGTGCAISKASGSMMTEAIIGKTTGEARRLFDEFHRLVTGELDPEADDHHLGKLKLFAGVRAFSSRAKCATLTWHAMICALADAREAAPDGAGRR